MKLEGVHHVTAITGDAPANVDFYVLLTPVWLGLRALAWLADRTSRPAGS